MSIASILHMKSVRVSACAYVLNKRTNESVDQLEYWTDKWTGELRNYELLVEKRFSCWRPACELLRNIIYAIDSEKECSYMYLGGIVPRLDAFSTYSTVHL